MRNPFKNLNKFDRFLWIFSLCAVIISFLSVQSRDFFTLISSLVGVTSLIFAAKGDVFGLMLMLAFSLVYSFVSFAFGYYGETIIYLCMQFPVCSASLVGWIKNPSGKGRAEVKVGSLKSRHIAVLIPLAAVVTVAFFFILRAFGTSNLTVSTLSVTTSFIALYLMALRIPAYAAAFTVNDIVLIVLWSLACVETLDYLPMVVCFTVFLINDVYSFINWTLRKKRQAAETENQ